MRNPDRIPLILEELRQLWEKHPDLRFMQLVSNIIKDFDISTFYIEDEKFLELLRQFSREFFADAATPSNDALQAAINRHVAKSAEAVARIPSQLRTIVSKSEAQASRD